MFRKPIDVIILLFTLVQGMTGQVTSYGAGYQTVILHNPAYSGSEGDGIMRLSYQNFYPGRGYNLHSFFFSYDSFFPFLHGGAGFYLSNDYLGGVINDLRGGFSYSYHLQADRDLFINGGLNASVYHRGYNRNNIILPDQIDPLLGPVLPSGGSLDIRGRTVFDVGAGFLVHAGRYSAGLSVSHLARPDLQIGGETGGRIDRKYVFQASGSFSLGRRGGVLIIPLVHGEMQGRWRLAGAGGVADLGFLSVSSIMLVSSSKELDIQTGISFDSGPVLVYYNYCFNIASASRLVPFSLVQRAGMAVRLNYVDKRKIIKTIIYPNL